VARTSRSNLLLDASPIALELLSDPDATGTLESGPGYPLAVSPSVVDGHSRFEKVYDDYKSSLDTLSISLEDGQPNQPTSTSLQTLEDSLAYPASSGSPRAFQGNSTKIRHERRPNAAISSVAADDTASLAGLAPSTITKGVAKERDEDQPEYESAPSISSFTRRWVNEQADKANIYCQLPPSLSQHEGNLAIVATDSEAFNENIRYFLPALCRDEDGLGMLEATTEQTPNGPGPGPRPREKANSGNSSEHQEKLTYWGSELPAEHEARIFDRSQQPHQAPVLNGRDQKGPHETTRQALQLMPNAHDEPEFSMGTSVPQQSTLSSAAFRIITANSLAVLSHASEDYDRGEESLDFKKRGNSVDDHDGLSQQNTTDSLTTIYAEVTTAATHKTETSWILPKPQQYAIAPILEEVAPDESARIGSFPSFNYTSHGGFKVFSVSRTPAASPTRS
jgi:hypothetical protein